MDRLTFALLMRTKALVERYTVLRQQRRVEDIRQGIGLLVGMIGDSLEEESHGNA